MLKFYLERLLENAKTQDFYSSQIFKAQENRRFSIRIDASFYRR